MRAERARGAVLYGCAVALLAAGGAWWFRAAPHDPSSDPLIEQWWRNAQQLLPDDGGQDEADTLALPAGADRQVLADVGSGKYLISVVCVGAAGSQVRVSLGEAGTDSGHGLNCADRNPSDHFEVGTSGQLRIYVSVSAAGPVVFRYSVTRTSD